MQTDLQNTPSRLPQVSRKPHSINSLFELIKLKKAEFSRQIDHLDCPNATLPHIHHDLNDSEQSIPEHPSTDPIQNDSQELRPSEHVPSKYRTVLQPSRTIADQVRSEKRDRSSHFENSLALSRKQNIPEPKNKIHRTKTEFRPSEPRKFTTNTATVAQQRQREEERAQESEQAKRRFWVAVQQVPRSMKQRNQDNLLETISSLEAFNPFFFRNQRILNICLLKMGKLLLRDSPYQLYRAGDQALHFYVILAGRVKIAEGAVRRVCQTGETVLEEALFGDRPRKVALERARVVGPTYLLQLDLEQYGKLKEELIRHGLKQPFLEMEAIIKRNYIIKNWMRNKRKNEPRH